MALMYGPASDWEDFCSAIPDRTWLWGLLVTRQMIDDHEEKIRNAYDRRLGEMKKVWSDFTTAILTLSAFGALRTDN